MSKIVHIYDIRHGEKAAGKDAEGKALNELTPKGFAQVSASAKTHLANLKPLMLFHSGQYRAEQTIEVCKLVGKFPANIHAEEGFNFANVAKPFSPFPDAETRVKARVAAGETETAKMWLEEWDAAPALRQHLTNCLLSLAVGSYGRGEEDITFIAASHSPTAELATPTPETTPRLNEADIAHYTVEVSDDGKEASILSCEVLHCPWGKEGK